MQSLSILQRAVFAFFFSSHSHDLALPNLESGFAAIILPDAQISHVVLCLPTLGWTETYFMMSNRLQPQSPKDKLCVAFAGGGAVEREEEARKRHLIRRDFHLEDTKEKDIKKEEEETAIFVSGADTG